MANNTENNCGSCGTTEHVNRRTLLTAAGLSGLAWLTPVAEQLAHAVEKAPLREPAKSVILIWLAGGPSQLETFDPHPGSTIAGETKAIDTAARGIQLAEHYEELAAEMQSVSLVRSVVSKEGDHERATYNVKNGYRPDPTVVHPSIGAVLCHQLDVGKTEIPRHVSIQPNQWAGRGGYLGNRYDAFKINDPRNGIPDVKRRVSDERFDRRLHDLTVIDRAFASGRLARLEERRTSHRTTIDKALRMMSSEQLTAFDVMKVPKDERMAYGDTPFGRGLLAAARLIEVGVRCVEVTLSGWDSHINNHDIHAENAKILDPAIAALLRHLRARDLLERTVVICGGEFGRTPAINPAAGRDHWPHGFSIALAGGGIAGGRVIGATDPSGSKKVEDPVQVEDIHATVLHTLGVNFKKELDTPVGRPMKLSHGKVLTDLLSG